MHGLGNRNCVLEGGLTNIRQNFRASDSQPRPGASQGDTLQASPEGSSVATALGNPPHGHITHSVKARAEVSSSRTDGEVRKGLVERVQCTKQITFWRERVGKGGDGGCFIWREKGSR